MASTWMGTPCIVSKAARLLCSSSRLALPLRRVALRQPGRTFSTKTRATADTAADVLYQATGVPLVEKLMAMGSMEEAVRHSGQLLAVAIIGVAVGTLVMHVLDRRVPAKPRKDFNLWAEALASSCRPGKVMLPIYGLAYAATILSSLAQVAATKLQTRFAALCYGQEAQVLMALKWITQLVQDTSELVLIIMSTWALIDFKNRVLKWTAIHILSDSGKENDGVVHLLRPLNGMLNFVILVAAAATTLTAYGINIGPLLASVGGIGVIVGLITQSLMGNIAAAVTLYTTRPFSVGDHVQLLADTGETVVEGTVVTIEPMRTVIHDEHSNPVYLNNTEVANYIIRNMTQGKALREGGVAEQAVSSLVS